MKQALRFSIVGEDDDTYEVTIERDAVNIANLQALCSCDKAQTGLVSENLDDVMTLRDWIKGSDIDVAMKALSKAKTDLKLAHERVDHCRRNLVRRMLD